MSTRMLLVSAPAIMAALVLASCASPQTGSERRSLSDSTFRSTSSEDQCNKPKQEHSYLEPCVSLGGRGSQIPIRDVPSSVQIINRDLLDDQKALRIEDALRNVSGVH